MTDKPSLNELREIAGTQKMAVTQDPRSSKAPNEHWVIGHIAVNDQAATRFGAPAGYFCTICTKVSSDPIEFQDFHLTRDQAESLVSQLKQILEG